MNIDDKKNVQFVVTLIFITYREITRKDKYQM